MPRRAEVVLAAAAMIALQASSCADDEPRSFPPITIPQTPGPAPVAEPDECHAEADFPSCQACLEAAHPGGAASLHEAFLESCLCGAAAPCEPSCAGDCANLETASEGCTTCAAELSAYGEPCVAATLDVCRGDPACATLAHALQGCPGGPQSSSGTGGMTGCDDVGEFEGCIDCCTTTHALGGAAWIDALIGNCACAATAPCNADCNTSNPSTDACNDDGSVNHDATTLANGCVECINDQSGTPCAQAFGAECKKNPACIEFDDCREPCFDLPGAP